jgi:acetylornithine deacetylase
MKKDTPLKQDKTTKNKIAAAVETIKWDLVAFISQLVRIRSLPGEEKAVQEVVARKLENLGFNVTLIPIDLALLENHEAFSHDGFPVGKRLNVVGRWPGSGGIGRSLILNGHVDVVSPGNGIFWDDSPWSGRVNNGRIYGRGSADMKAGLAAEIFACEVLQKLGYSPLNDIMVHSVVGEETGGCGTLTNILRGFSADAAIIAEPTGLRLLPVQSGALSFRIKVTGKSTHACMKNKGVSAIEKFYVIFHAIEELDRQRHSEYHNPLFEDPGNVAPISFGTLKCGDWPSSIPDMLVAEGRFGLFPGETAEDARQVFEEAVKQAARQDEWLNLNMPVIEWFEGQFESGLTGLDEPVIHVLSACHEAILGQEVEMAGATYGSDLRLFTNYAGIPAVLYGPGDVSEAHSVNESISIADVVKAVNVLAYTILNWCGGVLEP